VRDSCEIGTHGTLGFWPPMEELGLTSASMGRPANGVISFLTSHNFNKTQRTGSGVASLRYHCRHLPRLPWIVIMKAVKKVDGL
jgi:hypothetical protein